MCRLIGLCRDHRGLYWERNKRFFGIGDRMSAVASWPGKPLTAKLKKMKVIENWNEVFKNDNTTYYVWNTDDNRSRRDDKKTKGYVRSDSHPRFFRTASRNTYVRDNSRFRRG